MRACGEFRHSHGAQLSGHDSADYATDSTTEQNRTKLSDHAAAGGVTGFEGGFDNFFMKLGHPY